RHVQDVAAIDNATRGHQLPGRFWVELAEFLPFGCENHQLCILQSRVRGVRIVESRKDLARIVHALCVINGHRSTAQRERTSNRQRRPIPHVMKVCFESTAQLCEATSQQRTIECPLGEIYGKVAAANISSSYLT